MRRILVSVLVPAFMLVGLAANPAIAQDKAKAAHKATNTTKVLHEDDRVRVMENTTKPGEMNANVVRGVRVVRFLSGGSQERTYADGKKEKLERKTGEVIVAWPDKQAYFMKNIGQTTIVTYVVQIKQPMK